jgi:type VI secretion system protein VasD
MSPFIGDTARFEPRRGGARHVATAVLAWLLGSLLALAACSSPPKPTLVSATLKAGTDVNPDLRKRASPIVVRVYELKSSAAFEGADFVSLYERDQATLAAEMGAREEFTLRPGETRQWDKATAPDTKFIGVMAAFRDIEHARWKSIVPVKANAKNTVSIRLDQVGVDATVQ